MIFFAPSKHIELDKFDQTLRYWSSKTSKYSHLFKQEKVKVAEWKIHLIQFDLRPKKVKTTEINKVNVFLKW